MGRWRRQTLRPGNRTGNVTGAAICDKCRMIGCSACSPRGKSAVTCIALRRGRQVRRRFHLRVLGEIRTTVALRAPAGCIRRMQETHQCPGHGTGVAGVALPRFRNVRHALSVGSRKRIGAVVTVRARPGRSRMVHERRLERYEVGMAGIALCVGRFVVGRLV